MEVRGEERERRVVRIGSPLAARAPQAYRLEEMSPVEERARLDPSARAVLLRIAREAISAHLERRECALVELPAILRSPAGAFVTLRSGGELRGCIGTLDASRPLFEAVADCAVSAATRDPRFPPLSPRELGRVDLEISVLSRFVPVTDPATIVIGRDGLLIRGPARSGLLLPQVAVEYGWDVPTFLEHLCVKAGLAAGSWRRDDCRLESFTAEVFGEADSGERQAPEI